MLGINISRDEETIIAELHRWRMTLDDGYYILDKFHVPQLVVSGVCHDNIKDLLSWARWMDIPGNKRVDKTVIGDVTISTVFLGRNLFEPGMYFETMVSGGKYDQVFRRYPSYEAAMVGHQQWIREVSEDERTEMKQEVSGDPKTGVSEERL